MKGTKVASIPHPLGPRPQPKGWTPQGQEHYDNERSARSWLAERQDRSDPDRDPGLKILAEIDRLHPIGKGGTGLEDWPTLRPRRHRVFARRRELYAEAKAAGLAIPDLLDRPRGQQAGAFFDVVAVGAGVTSVRVGDAVVANACVGRDLGDTIGPGLYELECDQPAGDERLYETEQERLPDGSMRTVLRRMGDRERRVWGVIDAVVVG